MANRDDGSIHHLVIAHNETVLKRHSSLVSITYFMVCSEYDRPDFVSVVGKRKTVDFRHINSVLGTNGILYHNYRCTDEDNNISSVYNVVIAADPEFVK